MIGSLFESVSRRVHFILLNPKRVRWTRSFLGAGLAYKSTSRLRMARWHRDQGPMALLPPGVAENPEDR
jgi:hypothetical protein